MSSDKVRENRARRAARRQGLQLRKSRLRDPRALGYGTYMLVDARTGARYAYGGSDGYGLSLHQVEAVLAEGRSR